MLRAIRQRGGQHYLYTHRDQSAVDALKNDGLWAYFTDKVTKEDGFPYKPAPNALHHLITKHGLDKRLCCMVGDRSIDLDAGKNAGMAAMLFDPDGFYRSYETPFRFHSFQDMINAL